MSIMKKVIEARVSAKLYVKQIGGHIELMGNSARGMCHRVFDHYTSDVYDELIKEDRQRIEHDIRVYRLARRVVEGVVDNL